MIRASEASEESEYSVVSDGEGLPACFCRQSIYPGFLVVILMSNKKMTGYIRGAVDEDLDLGTLAAKTLIAGPFDETVVTRSLISSLVATWTLDLLVAGQGPILFGVAHSDYSSAEIEEYVENAGSWDEGNKIAREVAKRNVRIIGTMVGEQGSGNLDVRFNTGKPVKTKLNWILSVGDTIDLWAYNLSASALTTSAPILRASGHVNLWAR